MAREDPRSRLSPAIGLFLACSVAVTSGKPVKKVDSQPIDDAYFKLPPLTESSVLGLAGASDKNTTEPRNPGARIAYGDVAQPGAWPYVGLTLITGAQGGTSQCASTKITPRVALTAGHCLDFSGGISNIRTYSPCSAALGPLFPDSRFTLLCSLQAPPLALRIRTSSIRVRWVPTNTHSRIRTTVPFSRTTSASLRSRTRSRTCPLCS